MNLNTRITTVIPLLIIQTLIVFFGVTCQDSAKRIIVDDDSAKLYHLTGLALDYQTDLPVSEITVKVIADSTYETVTNSTGHYSLIIAAEPGVYEISFEGRDYANMSGEVPFPDDDSLSDGLARPASLPALISVTKDVRLYPLTKQVTGTVLGCYTWDYPDVTDDSICILPLPYCAPVYISYIGVNRIERAEVTLDCSLYSACTDNHGNYSFDNIPHTDSAFIGTIPFYERGSFFYGSRSAISLDNPEPVDIQLVAAPMFDRMYEYIGYDTLQRQIVSGWLGMNDPDSMGQFTGAWSIKKYNPDPWPIDLGPQDGSGSLLGQVHGNELSIDLNPGWADNNVILVADTSYHRLLGTWHYSTFVGEVNRGAFEAIRIELEP